MPLPSPTVMRRFGRELVRPGEQPMTGAEIARGEGVALIAVIVLTNVLGSIAVLAIAAFVVPIPIVAHPDHVKLLNALLAAAYVVAAVIIGVTVGSRRLRPEGEWLLQDRAPTLPELRGVLRAPLLLFRLQVGLWLVAAVLFAVFNGRYSLSLGVRVGLVVATTGVVTAACSYLLTELLLRPLAARALAHGMPERLIVPGVATRSLLGWVLGTALQLVGIVAIGVMALTGDRVLTAPGAHPLHQLGVAMVVLGGTGIAVGLLVVVLVARTTADPIDSVRRALEAVKDGRFDVHVPVYDGTQIGQLQLGFNEMATGLEERERIRKAFGTYVDPSVAREILEHRIEPGGEEIEVTCMFIDIRNFTGFAEKVPPAEVVSALNELFEGFVAAIGAHGGRVDKFIGDGLMAVFGAPSRLEDHADAALATALQIAGEVSSSVGLQYGIGLNSGPVIAGNLGGAGRLEFGVIGDAVNVAARVEAATRQTGDRILLTGRTRELLRDGHPRLIERPDVELKGKGPETLYAPEL